MKKAIGFAAKLIESDEVPVAAIVVDSRNNEIVSIGLNSMNKDKDPTMHAEMTAIKKASKKLNNSKLEFCDIYVTLEPCPMCAQAISFARIRRLYFAAYDMKGGGVDNGARIFDSSSCHHKPEIYGGIMEEEACSLLKDFFKNKR